MAQTGEELWIKVRDGLQAKLSKPTFETFIRPTGCSGFANGELKLLAPNPFASVRLREQLLPTIAEMASSISGQPVQVTVLAETALPLPDATDEASAAADAAPSPAAQESASAPARNGSPRRYLPGLNPRYVFGRFVVGPNSRMAHAAALAVATLVANSCDATPCARGSRDRSPRLGRVTSRSGSGSGLGLGSGSRS